MRLLRKLILRWAVVAERRGGKTRLSSMEMGWRGKVVRMWRRRRKEKMRVGQILLLLLKAGELLLKRFPVVVGHCVGRKGRHGVENSSVREILSSL